MVHNTIEAACSAEVKYRKIKLKDTPQSAIGKISCEQCVLKDVFVRNPDIVLNNIVDFKLNTCPKMLQ